MQRVLQRIIELPPHLRVEALRRVVTLMGLRRKIGPLLEEEARKMPITEDILDHPILGPRMREGMELGLAQGSEQGIKRGELAILTDLIAKRFGPPEAWVSLTLEKMNAEELRTVAVRVLDAKSVAELFD